ncbi:hypothetical protein IVA90_13015 [Bradyrhizobium sp. 151]|nr:hypothetical protein [Bradyrhizobium sp. 151]
MEAVPASKTWDVDAFLVKAQRYAETMLSADRDDWRFALWSSLTLEHLLRAALADFSPAMLADKADWNNLFSALGYVPTAKKFIPKSISTAEVISRLSTILPEFDTEIAGFCQRHTSQRNAELHSGEIAFDGQKPSSWLGLFYKASKALLASVEKDLAFLFGDKEASTAEKLINAHADEAAKAVQGTISAHKVGWEKKEQSEREKLRSQADLWATRQRGHRVTCPACQSAALVLGDSISAPQKTIDGDVITEKQEHLPSRFECIACGMKIAGLSQLTAAGLGDVYVQAQSYDASEYYASPDQDMDGWEPDNNEPY